MPIFEFGPFRVDSEDRLLLRDGKPVPLPPKVTDTLLLLLARAGHVVEKDEIIARVWPDTFVEEASLSQNISLLRKALGESHDDHRYIETIPKRGYRFVGPLTEPAVIGGPSGSRRILAIALAAAALGIVASTLLLLRRETPPSPASPAGAHSIAVLPFLPIGAPGEHEYLGLGMADALITKLASVHSITVRPTSSVRKYASGSEPRDPIQAGRELDVSSILEGSVQRSGERVRVTLQLIRVRDGAPLWSGTFDEKFTDLFTVQDSIADQVTRALALTLSAAERARLQRRETRDPAAYESYLKGRFFWNKRTEVGFKASVEHFTRAIELDPLYALAYAGLADSYNLFNNYDLAPATETGPKAKAAALKALEIDPSLAEAHTSLALVREVYDFDQVAADESYRRAVELNPNYSTAHHWYGLFLVQMGRSDDAIRHLEQAKRLDPLSSIIDVGLAWAHYFARRHDRAIVLSRQTNDLVPDFWPAHLVHGWALEQSGRYDEAREEFTRAIELSGRNTLPLASLGHLYAVSGKAGEAMKILDEIEARSRQRYVSAYFPAAIYTGLGRTEEAFRWLERAERERAYWLISLHVNPWFDPLREDARFIDLERRLGFNAYAAKFGPKPTS
jgi:DNA-binding winged helix-turn-helix (wHTH) protein/TolB-like protein/Tfp pilus assembly protein PilF